MLIRDSVSSSLARLIREVIRLVVFSIWPTRIMWHWPTPVMGNRSVYSCYVNLITLMKKQLGDDGEETITISRADLGIEENSAFYPHFMVKNYAVHLHFGRRSSTTRNRFFHKISKTLLKTKVWKPKNSDLWESAPKALRDFKLIGSVPSEERIAGPVEPQVNFLVSSFFVSKLSGFFWNLKPR